MDALIDIIVISIINIFGRTRKINHDLSAMDSCENTG